MVGLEHVTTEAVDGFPDTESENATVYGGSIMYRYASISRKRLLLPEEIPILSTFFHIANIGRYNPEFWKYLKNQRQGHYY